MFKNLKMSTKLYFGFTVMILLVAIVSYIGWNGLENTGKRVENADDANWIIKKSLNGRIDEKNFMLRKDAKYMTSGAQKVSEIHERAKFLRNKLKDINDHALVDNVSQNIDEWKKSFQEYVDIEKKMFEAEEQMVVAARNAINQIEDMRTDQKGKLYTELRNQKGIDKLKERIIKADDANRLNKWILDIRRHEKNFMIRKEAKYVTEIKKTKEEIMKLCSDLLRRFKTRNNIEQTKAVIKAVNNYYKEFDHYEKYVAEQKAKNEKMVAAARVLVEKANELRGIQKQKMQKDMNSATYLMIIFAAIGIVFGLLISITITKGVTGTLKKAVDSLMDSSEQIGIASSELSSAAQELSSSSNEQASSIEETSSSLEEIGGMIDNNVTNAESAYELSNKVKDISERGNETMNKLEVSMSEILKSNEEIENLVKVISNIGEKTQVMDEIVFQTKLLSFNASVEAERAGEHGRGFAVVAQEVGNLAQMSGKSAQEIAEIVKNSIKEAEAITTGNKKKVEEGNTFVVETAKNLKEIMESVVTVSSGARQVLDASKDQAKGIGQINTAMGQVDKATQENAATAEETASSSEELSAQVDALNNIVKELVALVDGVSAKMAQDRERVREQSHSKSNASAKTGTESKVIKINDYKDEKPGEKAAASSEVKEAVGSDVKPEQPSEDGWERL